jgi:hypothetical protein
MRRCLALLFLAVGQAACTDGVLPTEASPAEPGLRHPTLAIADAPRGFTPGFYWLPPMVNAPALGDGTADAMFSPVVEIPAPVACER